MARKQNDAPEATYADPDVVAHYTDVPEGERLLTGPGKLERVRTEELLTRYLPPPPCRVLDVGGGSGVYSAWLADAGYDVELVDPVPIHIEQARVRFAEAGLGPERIRQGDARDLPFGDDAFDAVLLLGPLYHLLERAERIRALGEASRVARPDALVFVAAISRFASLMDGFFRGYARDARFAAILREDLRSGDHRNPTDDERYFTSAHFHLADEIGSEIREAGLRPLGIAAVDGPLAFLPDFDAFWDDDALRSLILECLRRVETETTLLGASGHLLAVARRMD